MKAALLTLVLLAATPVTAWACPICFNVEENEVTRGIGAAVLVLVGVTTGVLSGFGMFIARFVRRSRGTE